LKKYILLILNPNQNLGIQTMKFQTMNSNPSLYKMIQIRNFKINEFQIKAF